ncbi:putative catechol oxidase [Helianthus annuus]|uniref:Catechol oxidase n=1 Tax=Helianthus annuus TaxID=4232 RepID=A0A251TE56_HELAN|nr:polyphenol oxidase I, chloroplastic [Helianthus annuus]KAF5814686.1 putative catechol oxidase [Helianthus annuus]KAJ0593261.1 putative catechol oxidase [Helianthus annuus]KAJ0601090.1 putative catechol oxidase [Helianthus annuus]KAJ0608271.1 putative catechol oxidase [Helianthus annuus]KAJ0768336.1 putative catechol oxidase [Helianthus annuus]
MASLSLSAVPTTPLSSRSSPLFSKTSTHRFNVSCNSSADENPKLILPKSTSLNVDRRNMLLGLGGLYGAASLTNIGSASAFPVTAPDNIADCVAATDGVRDPDKAIRGTACCPPKLSDSIPPDYVLPNFPQLRIRPPAQRVDDDYIVKYRAAIAAMRALPDEDPHSWKQQGKIHCAYCNGGYSLEMNGLPDVKLQIHNSSLFYPFHRWYLYFYERILGKLIGDDTFALPYWNWDNPTGMMLPAMLAPVFDDRGNPNQLLNPLFDPFREVKHLPPAIVDLQYRGTESGLDCIDQINTNLSTMYSQMINQTTDTFFGTNPGDDGKGTPGSIENGAHTSVHIWTGNSKMPNREDMGNFYSAGYDPAFYVHHANVDRMWHVWKGLNPLTNKDPIDDDWLNASYVFYDENRQLVRVYNRDAVDVTKMGYDFEPSRTPWINNRPVARVKASNVAAQSVGVVKKVEEMEFPVKLDQTVKVLVKRPSTKRSEDDKKKANEILFLNGIKYNGQQFFKFDVLVDDVDDGIETTAASSEFAGTFAQVPHGLGGEKMFMTTGRAFVINELLEDIEAEDDEYVLVTLVPRAGADDATVSEIKIQLVPTE